MGRLEGKKVVLLAADLTHDEELYFPKYWLAWEDATTIIAGINKEFTSRFGRALKADITTAELEQMHDVDAVVIPGGFGPDKLRMDRHAVNFVKRMSQEGRLVAAICHAAWVLISAGIVPGKRLTCVPAVAIDVINAGGTYVDEPVVRDGNLITSRHPPDLPAFTTAIVDFLSQQAVMKVREKVKQA